MLKTLQSVKGVKHVSSLGRVEAGSYDFLIEPEEGKDVREDVFDRVVSRGKKILMLNTNKLTLEHIFLRLTEAEDDELKRLLKTEDKPQNETDEDEIYDFDVVTEEEEN